MSFGTSKGKRGKTMSKDIIASMATLLSIYEKLYALGIKKVDLIKKGDMAQLDVAIREETTLVHKLQLTETMREKQVMTFLQSKGKKIKNATVTDVIAYVEKEEKQTLRSLQENLVECMQKVQRQNEHNKQLIEESLRFVNLSLDLMIPYKEDISYGRPEDEDERIETGHSLFDSKA